MSYVKINYDIYEYFERKINDEPLHCVNTLIYIYIQVIDELCCERRCHFSKPHLLPMDFEKKGALGKKEK